MATNNSPNSSHSHAMSSHIPACSRCHQQLGDQLVRALDGTFHPECFTCLDCQAPVAAMFFPFVTPEGQTLPLCERDYFRRLELVCGSCGEPLKGAYIIALNQKYHTDHFMCCACSTTFGTDDSYYEHEGKVFCHYHYSTQFAVMCAGCDMAILKQYVEIDRNEFVEHWHPECYMIHKFWSVKVRPATAISSHDASQNATLLLDQQHEMENKVFRIWQVLSAFEESSAMCISEMLLNVSNGAFLEGICLSERFLVHVEALFAGVDELCKIQSQHNLQDFKYTREAKMLCKKIINFFSLLAKAQDMESKKLGMTQELLSLVTGLAHYLKILIRIALTAALDLEQAAPTSATVSRLLAKVMEVAGKERHSRDSQRFFKANGSSDTCQYCRTTIEDECIKYNDHRWHVSCFHCRQCKRALAANFHDAVFNNGSQSIICTTCTNIHNDNNDHQHFQHVSRLSQYTYLLRVALSRLCSLLQITEYSNKTKPYIKDTMKDSGMIVNEKQHEVVTSTVEEKTNYYPTHITDVKSTVSLDRKMSRSFKSAKRSTILGNANDKPSSVEEMDQPNEDDEDGHDDHQQQPTVTNRKAPARLDSLIRRMDQHKDLPPLPASRQRQQKHEYDHQQQQHQQQPHSQPRDDESQEDESKYRRRVSVGLDDIPMVGKQFIQEQKKRQPNTSIKTPLTQPDSPFVPGTGLVSKSVISSYTGKPRVYLSELSALQYMIMRHVAVVRIEPYVSDFFTHDELLQLIQLKKASIWGKFFTSFKKPGGVAKKQSKAKEEGTFGVPLEILTEKTGVESNLGAGASPIRIAAFIDDAITAMRQMDMSVEGVFRKNGNIRRLKQVSEQLDKNPNDVNFSTDNAVQIAALLKKWLRELPDPLLTYRLHKLFICAQRIDNPTARKRVLHLACCMLPRCNRDTMEVLFLFLRWVALFSHVTTDVGSRMDIPNLARVIAPNILLSTSKDPLKDESFLAINSVEMLLESYEEFCMVPEDLEPFLHDSQFQEGKGDMSSKDFLKRVEHLLKKKGNHGSCAPSTTDLRQATNELRIATDRHHHSHKQQHHPEGAPPARPSTNHIHSAHHQSDSSTSIYAQQQYLPYPNRHPSSDFVPGPIATTRQSSLHNHPSNSTGAPTSPLSHSGGSLNQQLYHQQQHQHQHHRRSLNDPTSPSEYSPSPLRATPIQHELQS
ncbi:hypothetical protein BCR42DRAFT_494916 [Absidia repens]|uniref:RhoGAP-domain-containing protein n=1 Tax=Absidia repens TaxID=90262 RepID=A0A1X2I507_9FUNG|nr:hypothetical protein BCR42DRAFT_494916 [Absidia repens]